MTEVDNQLKAIYNKNGLNPSANRLYDLARKQGLKVSLKTVQAWISRRPYYIEHTPNTADRKSNAFRITDVPNSYAVDAIVLKDFNPAVNEGYRGLLPSLCGINHPKGMGVSISYWLIHLTSHRRRVPSRGLRRKPIKQVILLPESAEIMVRSFPMRL